MNDDWIKVLADYMDYGTGLYRIEGGQIVHVPYDETLING